MLGSTKYTVISTICGQWRLIHKTALSIARKNLRLFSTKWYAILKALATPYKKIKKKKHYKEYLMSYNTFHVSVTRYHIYRPKPTDSNLSTTWITTKSQLGFDLKTKNSKGCPFAFVLIDGKTWQKWNSENEIQSERHW